MRVFQRPLLFAICLLGSVLALSQASTWKEYIYAEDGFAVSSPVEPTLIKRTMKPAAGEIESHFYFIALEHCQLVLMYAQLHPNDKRTPKEAFEDAKKGISIAGARLISEKSISLDGYPGIELESDDGKHHQRGRLYAIGRRMYQLGADVPSGQEFPAEVQRWYESFHLVSAKK